MTHHRVAHRSTYREGHPSRDRVGNVHRCDECVHHQTATPGSETCLRHPADISGAPQSMSCGQHRLGREAGSPLGATRGQDGSPSPCPHPDPKTVRLRATAIVRLEGALHGPAPKTSLCRCASRYRSCLELVHEQRTRTTQALNLTKTAVGGQMHRLSHVYGLVCAAGPGYCPQAYASEVACGYGHHPGRRHYLEVHRDRPRRDRGRVGTCYRRPG